MLCNTCQDVVLFLRSEVGLLSGDCFENSAFRSVAAFDKGLRLSFQRSAGEFGLNLNPRRLNSVKEPFATVVDCPNPDELEISLGNDRPYFSNVKKALELG